MPRLARLLPAALLVPVALSGCRMYGSHDATDLTIAQYEQAVTEAVATAARTQATWTALDAAAQNPALRPVLDGYAPLARRQDSLVKYHVQNLEAVQHPSLFKRIVGVGGYQYRAANRAYGALATEQAFLNDRLATLGATLAGQPTATTYLASIVDDSRYYFTPPFYHKLIAASNARDLLASARTYRAPAAADSLRANAERMAPVALPDSASDGAPAALPPLAAPTPGGSAPAVRTVQ